MIDKLKKRIFTKFGSITKFAALIKVDRYELQKLFAASEKKLTKERKDRLKELNALVTKTDNADVGNELTEKIRAKIKLAIEEQFESVSKFCEQNPIFNTFSVYQIINGNRKTVNKSVKDMMKILNITLDEKEA